MSLIDGMCYIVFLHVIIHKGGAPVEKRPHVFFYILPRVICNILLISILSFRNIYSAPSRNLLIGTPSSSTSRNKMNMGGND